MGETLTVDLLFAAWVLPVAYAGIVLLNAGATLFMMPFVRCEPELRIWFALGQSYANVLPLPLLVAPSICAQIEFESSVLSDNNGTRLLSEAECNLLSEVYLILFILIIGFFYWLVIVPSLKHFTKPELLSTDGTGTVSISELETSSLDVILPLETAEEVEVKPSPTKHAPILMKSICASVLTAGGRDNGVSLIIILSINL